MQPKMNRNPRILIVVNVFDPDRGGGGAIFSDLCYGLAERGFDVTVRCAYPYYPEWKDKSGKNGLNVQRYSKHGVNVERYGIYIPKNPKSLWERLVYEASFFVSLIRSLPRGGDFDLAMTYCPLVGAVAFGVVWRTLRRHPLWLNVQDLSADAAAASGIARGALIKKTLSGVQKFLFNCADVWSTISPVMAARLERVRSGGQEILYIPNWLNRSMAEAIRDASAGIPSERTGAIRLLYAGNIGGKQDLRRFCEFLRKCDVDFQFNIRGDGTEANAMREWIEQSGDSRFSFGSFLAEPDFARALKETDLFVITEKTGSGGSFIPCKMIAGVSSGAPILAICDKEGPLGMELAEHDLGPWFAWDNLGGAVDFLKGADRNSERMTTWRKNALRRAEFYNRDTVIGRFDAEIRRFMNLS
jgi:colanic acid biosynthesis glycosyl transferase WcaI